MLKDKLNCIYRLLAVATAVVLAGCAGIGAITPEQIVEARAKAYWNARMTAQVDRAYSLAVPGYRAARTLEQYKAQFGAGAAIKAFEVIKVTCEPLKCVSRIRLSAQAALPFLNVPEVTTHLDEIWLLEDGSWWRYEEL